MTSTGRYRIASGAFGAGTEGPLRRYTVEVEDDVDVDVAAFAAAVDATLGDPRSWAAHGVRLARIDSGTPDFRVTLASPAMVDRECLPFRTGGWLSCWNGRRAMLNVDRWLRGAATYGDDAASYRQYMVNHEVGHALGHGHVGCPAPGALAPVMVQQTKSLNGCIANPWPYPSTPVPTPSPIPTPEPSPTPWS